ncbi:MAG: hypothetical protein HRT57_01860, partial [Crocinitomicaceae bacterium]|nr:hypothetical protein [Crocinitomicaceae bacterium]
MKVTVYPEQQIQRINRLKNELGKYSLISATDLNKRPREKAWSALETMKHISIAHKVYTEKVDNAFSNSKGELILVDELKASRMISYLVKRFPPVKGEIKFKMKTTKKFRPIFENDRKEPIEVIQELDACLDELKSWVERYRTSAISLNKFNSAIGPVVRLNIPEACEFILCHG